ncbi:zinc finger dihydrouridine synthase [Guyanagaster necrorhizus]|uniref:tRNA-dihydrouridine(47) synthase [NAD(P)(+)] n=1 Tax=Guyanagaster necrorhizus TaxID=856835 RepID=A0A9P7VQZ6_9AGAR|nr:zinc finger dihydrouridine synthase [Guyanagaster necrorhizus MCA 3950]KAG7445828.1 zinc finger dihydrouridine synthase [Guyanagaster necrorhizus MCA 3950]
MAQFPPGTAPIKAEYLLSGPAPSSAPDDDAAEGSRNCIGGTWRSEEPRSSGPSRKKMSKEEKKAQRGQNKGRRFGKIRDEFDLCWKIANGAACEHGTECRFNHDIASYLTTKPRDIRISRVTEISENSPFIPETPPDALSDASICPVFAELGECRYGFKCRFLGSHVRTDQVGSLSLFTDEVRMANAAVSAREVNFVGSEAQKMLRSKKYQFPIADAYMKEQKFAEDAPRKSEKETLIVLEPEQMEMEIELSSTPAGNSASIKEENEISVENSKILSEKVVQRTGDLSSQADTPDVPVRYREKKRLNWSGKTYLAPLTTVGNLPFRRLCVAYGADITCGEMGLATSLLSGSKEEWSLVRRHPSESTFGVQVAGNKPNTLVPTAEVLAKEIGSNLDFVDLNCGCPIDLVFKAGSGSALLDAAGKLGRIVVGMNKALGEIPVTVKLRTGVKEGQNTVHKLMPRLSTEFGASCLTLHGRTRQQRYTKLADWDYIKQCVEAVRAKEAEEDLVPVPIFGGGDCFSSQDYWSCVEQSGVDGVMVARGALIKPWIFTEIKEHREWDISSRERLDLIGKYAEYGLSHFGTDTAGVNATRRYLCESLSFQYRYTPIGLLERLPGRINDRTPTFRGRDDLETLLASDDSRDWVKISEMFLGPAPEAWSFTPKHKSNSYDSQG